ncbi:MAIN-LIKE 1-like protein [Drosera capensis]
MNPRPLRQVGYFQTKFSLPSFLRRVDKLNHDQRAAIQRVGFGNLLHIPNQLLNKNLLAELMERWDSKKRAFVLPLGEITITTLDVALILGLRGMGNPVILTDDEPSADLWKDFSDATMPMKISVYFFEERLNVLGGQANEDFVRAFLMFTFGTFLFPNTTGKVDSHYLCLLEDIDMVSDYAWGAAVLEDIFHWLSRRKEEGIVYVGGCLILLLIIWTLQLSEAESKVDIIKELSASTTCPKEVSAAECPCSTAELISSLRINNPISFFSSGSSRDSPWPVISQTLGNMFKRRDKNTMEHMKTSSFITPDPVVRCEVTAASSYCIPEINGEQMEPQSSCLHNSVDTNLKIEICSNAENWKKFEEENNFLRKENTDLREEVERLKLEVATLRNERIHAVTLQDENEKLKKEAEELKRENASNKWEGGVVARLERILEGDYEDSTEDGLISAS